MPDWIIGILIASGIFALAVFLIVRTRKWKRTAARTEGVIVEFAASTSGSDRSVAPVIEFVDGSGETRRFRNNTSSMFDRFAVGDRLPVLFDRDDPERAKIDRVAHLYALESILIIVTLMVLLVALSKHPDIARRISALLRP